jgi:tetratricopeptide (TPR) repeat protein
MSYRPPDSLKQVASYVASSMFSNDVDQAELMPLIRQLKLNNSQDVAVHTAPGTEEYIGIWKKSVQKGQECFVRDLKFQKEWSLWANNNQINASSDKKRILYFGESVARGYLYDPHYTPAQVLNELLNKTGELEVEVIDLAKTNMELVELELTLMQGLQLSPDAIVIFAGNNWGSTLNHSLSETEVATIVDAIKENGHFVLKQLLENKMRELIGQFLSRLSTSFNPLQIPVMFILPEYNLLDWQSSWQERIITRLPPEQLVSFLDARAEANTALEAGNYEQAGACAERMIASDPSHPEGFEIMGKVLLQSNEFARARECFETARDTALFSRNFNKPRIYKVITDTLREQCSAHGFHIIDLPAIFDGHQQGRLPGRELFLDYCHLTAEGIQLAMAETAVSLLKILKGANVSRNELPFRELNPSKEVEAVANFCAAVHNAHYGQSYPVIQSLCRQAISSSSIAEVLMVKYADFASRLLSTTLCKSHEELVADEAIVQYDGGLGFLHKSGTKVLDLDMVNAITDALASGGVHISEEVEALRIKEHGIKGKINLLQSFYRTSSYDDFPGTHPYYLQSRHVESEFILVADASQAILFNITLRSPGRTSDAENITISMNGQQVAAFPAADKWNTYSFSVSPEALKNGINTIQINWPYRTARAADQRQNTLSYGKDAILDLLYEVFGEVHMFSAEIA